MVGYALLFLVYGEIRYGLDLWAASPDVGPWTTWATGFMSLFITSAIVALVMAIPVALLGALTALLVVGLASRVRGGMAGLAVAFGVVLIVHLALWQAGLISGASWQSATYLFWVGLPSLIYLLVAFLRGRAYAMLRARPVN